MKDNRLFEGTPAEWRNYNILLKMAEHYGKLVARRNIDEETARQNLTEKAATKPLPRFFGIGKLYDEFEKSCRNWSCVRERTPWKIKEAIRPLIAEQQKSWTILSAAIDANAAAGKPLCAHEIQALVENELMWALRRKGLRHARR